VNKGLAQYLEVNLVLWIVEPIYKEI